MNEQARPSAARGTMARAAGALVVGFAVVALVVGLGRAIRRERREPPPAVEKPSPAELRQVTITYFHGDERCRTCRAIESRTRAYVQAHLAEELASGRVRWRTRNFDLPENEALRDHYDLGAGGVVIQGPPPEQRWEELFDLWTLVNEEGDAFDAYLAERLKPYLETVR